MRITIEQPSRRIPGGDLRPGQVFEFYGRTYVRLQDPVRAAEAPTSKHTVWAMELNTLYACWCREDFEVEVVGEWRFDA